MARECDQALQEVHDLPQSMFGLERYVERVETLVTSEESDADPQWEPLLKQLRESHMQERTVEEELYEHLKLGYDLLSEDDGRLKDCFLYFAAFAEDSWISFHEILWGWIGEGLVPGNGGDDARVDAFSC